MNTTATRTHAGPVLIITGDGATREAIAALLPDVDATHTRDPQNVAHYWPTASAVIIGADSLAEVAAHPLTPRGGVYVVTTPDGPPAYIPGSATVPAECVVELSQRDAPAWLAARVRHLAAGGDAGDPPNGCGECGASAGQQCRDPFCQGTWH